MTHFVGQGITHVQYIGPVITPALIQEKGILACGGAELDERIAREVDDNVMFDPGPESHEERTRSAAAAVVPGASPPQPDARGNEVKHRVTDWDAVVRQAGERHHGEPGYRSGFHGRPSLETSRSPSPSLAGELIAQLRLSRAGDAERRAGVLIIHNLDDDGYFRDPSIAAIADEAEVPLAVAERVLSRIQRFEPVGVAARDLPECLRIQAHERGVADPVVLAIIDHHLRALQDRRFDRIAAALGVGADGVARAAKVIARLDPRPGSRVGGGEPRYVTPDVTVRRDGERLVVVGNGSGLAQLRISSYYRRLMAEGGAAAQYLRRRLDAAGAFIDAITKRNERIVQVMEVIVRHQAAFFTCGEPRTLRPLQQLQIAGELGFDKSTISRAVKDKFADTPFGVLPLDFFFRNPAPNGNAQDGASSAAVDEQLRQLVMAEDPASPHSDAQLAALMNRRGVRLARRTVAKYRERLRIGTRDQRRREATPAAAPR